MARVAVAKKGRPQKKRKGRPPRPDPPVPVVLRHPHPPPSPTPEHPNRTLHPCRQSCPLHDFTDEDFDGEKGRGRRKLKLVHKLPSIIPSERDERCFDSSALPFRYRGIRSFGHVSSSLSFASSSSYVDADEEPEEEEEEETIKPPKKRRIKGYDDGVGLDGSDEKEAHYSPHCIVVHLMLTLSLPPLLSGPPPTLWGSQQLQSCSLTKQQRLFLFSLPPSALRKICVV